MPRGRPRAEPQEPSRYTALIEQGQEACAAALAANVSRLRFERGWSRQDLAARTEIHHVVVEGLEEAKRDVALSTVVRIAECLETTPAELLLLPTAE